MIGRTLSHYKVLEKIGEGGMGEVYRTRDTKLDREVAVKVLPATFSENKERLARFEREARLLASLNHPNIAAIHELEESDGVHFLALEYVPGETLAERIKRGPIPVDEALPLFRQIAEGLEAAHEKGIIHRDLKPANIKVTPEGKVKVLDFGLAKAMAGEEPAADASQSPTLTKDTALGVILGTAAYMSPEQSRGKTVDKRTDIWAFGCCLYEALTSKTAFAGETVSDTIAGILQQEPNWQALPQGIPTIVCSLLRQCLKKDPNHRLQHIGDARIDIDDALSESSIELPPAGVDRRGAGTRLALIAMAAAALATLVTWVSTRPPPPVSQTVTRFAVSLPPDQNLGGPGLPLALSPDGRRLVYVAEDHATQQLYLRELEDFEANALPGTEGASNPFFSPDGQSVGFCADGHLKKISLSGGAVVTLCRAPPLFLTGWGGGSFWGWDDTILFSDDTRGFMQISADGGAPEWVTDPQGSQAHLWPQMLPDGRSLLSTIFDYANGTTRLSLVWMETGESRALLPGSVNAYQAR
jgi:serine/threonine-protein kinase